MAEPVQHQSQNPTAKGQILNDRTYQEVEYLKKNLGPILVAALAEICIRRPADPIEYLGHWLLRWRYNEELKRRDVQNALEVVRQKAWTKDDENMQPAVDQFGQGFTPGAPNGPPGYGGPLDAATIEEGTARKSGEAVVAPVEGSGSAEKRASQEHAEKRPSQAAGSGGEMRRPSQDHSRRGSTGEGAGVEHTASGEQPPAVEGAPSEGAPIEERRSSRKSAAAEEMKEPSGEALPPPAEEAPAPPAEEAPPAEDSAPEPEPANE